MFKERFPENFRAYADACKSGEVRLGRVFVTDNRQLDGPRWIVNFPTKGHWRSRTRLEWIESGMEDLVRVISERGIRSIAVPPLGCGNGGLDWRDVKPLLEEALSGIHGLDATIYEPTARYQNVAKKAGVERLTPARALVAEMTRQYSALGLGCTVLEVQKVAWFIARGAAATGVGDPLELSFVRRFCGPYVRPYSDQLRHLLERMDGSYLACEVRLADARPTSEIWFEEQKRQRLAVYLQSKAKRYLPALDWAARAIRGFESPLGMELLATVDWLLQREGTAPNVAAVRQGLRQWGNGSDRKLRIFDDRLIGLALERLVPLDLPRHANISSYTP